MGTWADTVCQQAEEAHGTGYLEADPVILNDDRYGDALDLGGELDQALWVRDVINPGNRGSR